MSEAGGGESPWSLERRLSRHLLVVLGSLWLLCSAAALAGLWHENDVLLDSALHEAAERLLDLPEDSFAQAGRQAGAAERQPHEEHVVYQVFDASGHLRFRSRAAPFEPLDELGAAGVRDVGGWRVYTLYSADGRRWVEAAETVHYRTTALWTSLGFLALTLALLLPATSVAVTLVLRRGFRALESARRELAVRDADDLRPIDRSQSPRELQPWLMTVNTLMRRLGASIQGERNLAARTAHELRTPLAAARAKIQRLAQTTTDGATRQQAQELVRRLDRLTNFSTRLMQLVRLESGVTLRHELVDLAVLARAVVEELMRPASRGRLRMEVAEHVEPVLGDVDAIGIALRNCIDNALKHGGAGALVTVLVDGAAIYVIDDGPGVPPQSLAKLIRPFERGMTAAAGSGLGLSIAHALMHQAGAELVLRSPILGGRGFASILRFDERIAPRDAAPAGSDHPEG
jgi:two-component system OmpR family sensor kinase